MMNPDVSILNVMSDPALLGSSFPVPAWRPWVNCAAALFGLAHERSAADQRFMQDCLGGRALPTQPVREGWLAIGRRGGKSRFAALVAVYYACFRDYRSVLGPGERGVVMIIAADRRQARVVHGYIAGLLHATPMLEALIVRETGEAIELTNGIRLEIHTASYRSVRGYTVVAAVCDELAFWRTDDAANPDSEILNALRPAMATVPDALLLCVSSPYARRGELWRAYREHFGQPGDVVVWQAGTRTMNETVPQGVIDRAYGDDEAVAAAEYGAQFRSDLETFVSREAIDAVTVPGRRELPPRSDVAYVAFVDPSGGSADSMTVAVAHGEPRDGQRVAVVDAAREMRAPFSPERVIEEFAGLLKAYGIDRVEGDHYGGAWPGERFERHGIRYVVCRQTKSELYRDALALLNSGQVELLDHPRLIAQLAALERRTGQGGRDRIDHPPGGHDDVVNACLGAVLGVTHAARVVPLVDLLGPSGRAWVREQEEQEIRAEIRRDIVAAQPKTGSSPSSAGRVGGAIAAAVRKAVRLSAALLRGDEAAMQTEIQRRRHDRAVTAFKQREAQEAERARRDQQADEEMIRDAIRHDGWYLP